MIVFYHVPDHLLPADEHNQAARAGQGCVEKVSGQEKPGPAANRDNHDWKFAALAFVYGHGVGKIQIVQVAG